MSGEVLLIVEDNPVNQKLLLMVLRPHGYRLFTANDGEEAVEKAHQLHPDLILMDLQLPRMNGFCAAQAIKGDPTTASTRIVALTAHAMSEEREHADQLGFEGYITKPVNTRTFPAELRAILDRHNPTHRPEPPADGPRHG